MIRIFFIFCFVACLLACKGKAVTEEKWQNIQGYAQGTTFAIQYSHKEGQDFQYAIDSIFHAVDYSMSTWVDSSIISRINNGPAKSYPIDSIFREVYLLSKEVHGETNGSFDVSLAPLIYAWGIGFSDPKKLSEQEVDSLKKYVGFNNFELQGMKITKKIPEASLDFNAIAQGYTADLIAAYLEKQGAGNYLVEVGGELCAQGTSMHGTSWKVGIDKPIGMNSNRELKAIVELNNKSMATSGNYRKFYEVDGEKFPHTIDPVTGHPVDHNLLSATVICETAALADAYATAIMVMGVKKAKEFLKLHPELEAYLIYDEPGTGLNEFYTKGLEKQIEILP